MELEYCDRCNTYECTGPEIEMFIEVLNGGGKEFSIFRCPDKEEQGDSSNCDFELIEEETNERIFVEVKDVIITANSEKEGNGAGGKASDDIIGRAKIINEIYCILNEIITDMYEDEETYLQMQDFMMDIPDIQKYYEGMEEEKIWKKQGGKQLKDYLKNDLKKWLENIDFATVDQEQYKIGENSYIRLYKKNLEEEKIEGFSYALPALKNKDGETLNVLEVLDRIHDAELIAEKIDKNIGKTGKDKFSRAGEGRKILLNILKFENLQEYFTYMGLKKVFQYIHEYEYKNLEKTGAEEIYLLYHAPEPVLNRDLNLKCEYAQFIVPIMGKINYVNLFTSKGIYKDKSVNIKNIK